MSAVAGQMGVDIFGHPAFLEGVGGVEMYWVSAEMGALVKQAARQLPADLSPIAAIASPILHAFAMFEEPLASWVSVDDHPSGPAMVGGLAWMYCLSRQWDDTPRECLGIIPLSPPFSTPGLVPLSSSVLFPSPSLAEQQERSVQSGELSAQNAADHDEDRRLVMALMLLLESTIVVSESVSIARPQRRRAARAGLPASVRVVRLRRASHHERADGDDSGTEWTHRWIVSGHWRNQACGPKQSERRLTWVAPHIKGPDDKPLVIRPTVRALVR